MSTRARFVRLAVLPVAIMGLVASTACGDLTPVSSATLTPVAPGGTATLGQHVSIDIQLSSLTLGSVSGINGVSLFFTSSSPNLTIGAFTPGSQLSGWTELVTQHSYFNFSAQDITTTGSLGTLDVWSNTAGTYQIGFDGSVTKTELGGVDGSKFVTYQEVNSWPLTLNSASVTFVPEPISAVLLLGGLGALLRRRK